MLSDRRTNGHEQREPLLVGERGQKNWHGASKELEEDALKNIRDKLGAIGNIYTREYSLRTGVLRLAEKARLVGSKVEEEMIRIVTSFDSSFLDSQSQVTNEIPRDE